MVSTSPVEYLYSVKICHVHARFKGTLGFYQLCNRLLAVARRVHSCPRGSRPSTPRLFGCCVRVRPSASSFQRKPATSLSLGSDSLWLRSLTASATGIPLPCNSIKRLRKSSPTRSPWDLSLPEPAVADFSLFPKGMTFFGFFENPMCPEN